MMKNKDEIEFICPLCKTKERIRTYIVEILNEADQIDVDTSVSPRFDCENCPGKMVPFHYVSINCKIFEYK